MDPAPAAPASATGCGATTRTGRYVERRQNQPPVAAVSTSSTPTAMIQIRADPELGGSVRSIRSWLRSAALSSMKRSAHGRWRNQRRCHGGWDDGSAPEGLDRPPKFEWKDKGGTWVCPI